MVQANKKLQAKEKKEKKLTRQEKDRWERNKGDQDVTE